VCVLLGGGCWCGLDGQGVRQGSIVLPVSTLSTRKYGNTHSECVTEVVVAVMVGSSHSQRIQVCFGNHIMCSGMPICVCGEQGVQW
jgi:hypothetical protein